MRWRNNRICCYHLERGELGCDWSYNLSCSCSISLKETQEDNQHLQTENGQLKRSLEEMQHKLEELEVSHACLSKEV